MALQFFMNGAACNPPVNFQELQIELNFDNNSPSATVNTTAFDFVGDEATFINAWLSGGINGSSPGITEGIPFQIRTCNINIFDGVLDLTAEGNQFDCDSVTVALKQTDKIDWLSDVADSFSFAYLASLGLITINDYVAVPYVISTIPDYTQAALLSIINIVIEGQILYTTLELTDIVNKISLGGGSAVATAGITSAQFLGYLLEFALLLTYLISLIVSFFQLMSDIIDLLIQEIKYKYGMRVQDLFAKACQHLGLQFESTILKQSVYKDLVIVPTKYNIKEPTKYRDKPDETENQKAYGYFDGTFGDLIRAMNDVFNAKVSIVNNALYFEVYDHFFNQAQYTLPDIVANPYQTNASELASNYLLAFQTDSEDLNTFDNYDKTNAQCIFSQVNTGVQKNVMLKNLTQKQLIFATAKRKEDYTNVENLVKGANNLLTTLYTGVYASVDAVISVINAAVALIGWNSAITNTLPSPVTFAFQPRIGAMLLDTDFIGVPRLFIADGNQTTVPATGGYAVTVKYIWQLNSFYTNAEFLLREYHSHSFWLDTVKNIHNQFYKFKDKQVPFCCTDYSKVLNNNWIKTSDGKDGKVHRLMWSPEKDEATIDYDIKEQFTNNIKQKFIVDGVEV